MIDEPDPEPDPARAGEPDADSRWRELLMNALQAEGVPADAEASLRFISVEEMTELNTEYMGGTGPTDVLSFPIDGLDLVDGPGDAGESPVLSADVLSADELSPELASGPPVMVGDVVICRDVAAQAVTGDHTLDDEIALLVVHGALHLVGHDHFEPDERARMQAREQALLGRFHQ